MENATKALLMAGGVLIGVLLISIAVYLFRVTASFSNQYEKTEATKELAMYNNKFEKYEGRNDLTIHDIVSVNNLATEYKTKYNKTITVVLDGVALDTTDINELIKADTEDLTTDERITYSCISITYSNGNVNYIKFKKN